MQRGYIEKLIKNLNEKTGTNFDYMKVCNSLHPFEVPVIGKEDSEKRLDDFCNEYRRMFTQALKGFRREFEKTGKIVEVPNFLAEFDGMMNEIFESQFKQYTEADKYGLTISYGDRGISGKEKRYSDFKNIFNSATDYEIELKQNNLFNENRIFSDLEEHTNNYDPSQYNEHRNNSNQHDGGFYRLASTLKVARDQYKNKGFFSRIFAFKERKLINNAKKALINSMKKHNENPGLNSDVAEKYLKDAITSSYKYNVLLDSIDKPELHPATTKFNEIKDEYDNEYKKSEKKFDDYSKAYNKNKLKKQAHKQYSEFVKYYNLDTSKEQSDFRHKEYNEYKKDPDKYEKEHKIEENKATKEKMEIGNEKFEVGSYNPEKEATKEIRQQILGGDEFSIESDERTK